MSSSKEKNHQEETTTGDEPADGIDNEKAKEPTDGDSKSKKKQKPYNRPGMNSYLKLVLDDHTIDRLSECASMLRDLVQEINNEHETNSPTTKEDGSRKKRKLSFRPRSRNSLHLTFFFGGEVLCELEPEELTAWHQDVSKRLEASNFILDTTEPTAAEFSAYMENVKGTFNTPNSAHKDEPITGLDLVNHDYRLRITGFCLFPPRRNNLIVALLDASPAMHDLHNDLRDIARRTAAPSLLSTVVKRSKDRWTPHITLGNLYGGTKKDWKQLRPIVDKFQREHSFHSPAIVKKISMGGPVPQQVQLGWDFCRERATDH